MRRNPDDFSDELTSSRSLVRMASDEKLSVAERLQELIPKSELNDCTKSLLGFLFPSLSEEQSTQAVHIDAFLTRRPLLSTLRLGLLPARIRVKRFRLSSKANRRRLNFNFKKPMKKAFLTRLRIGSTIYIRNFHQLISSRFGEVLPRLPLNRIASGWRLTAQCTKKYITLQVYSKGRLGVMLNTEKRQ